jgi:hypothetical protein
MPVFDLARSCPDRLRSLPTPRTLNSSRCSPRPPQNSPSRRIPARRCRHSDFALACNFPHSSRSRQPPHMSRFPACSRFRPRTCRSSRNLEHGCRCTVVALARTPLDSLPNRSFRHRSDWYTWPPPSSSGRYRRTPLRSAPDNTTRQERSGGSCILPRRKSHWRRTASRPAGIQSLPRCTRWPDCPRRWACLPCRRRPYRARSLGRSIALLRRWNVPSSSARRTHSFARPWQGKRSCPAHIRALHMNPKRKSVSKNKAVCTR